MSDSSPGNFDIQVKSDYVLVVFKGRLEADSAKSFNERLPELLPNPPVNVIFNCDQLTNLSASWIRALMQAHQKLKEANRQLRLTGVSESIALFLKSEGLSMSLRMCPSVQEALQELGQPAGKVLDVNFVNPFLAATVKTLETQVSLKVHAGQIYRKDPKDKFTGDISGVIGLVSPAFTGSVVISFPSKTFLGVMSRMLGEEYTELTKEIEDGAAELTNIIFGQAKTALNELGYGIKTALPSVVSGEGHSILQVSNGPRVVVPFESEAGPFFVEICLASND